MRRVWLLLLLVALGRVAWTQASEIQDMEKRVVDLTNQVRLKYHLGELRPNDYLARAARSHSEEMARLNFFDHLSPNAARKYPWDRVNLMGADADAIAENLYLAEGYQMVEIAPMAIRSWENSPEHRHNLLDPAMTSVGVGVAVHGGQIYVTQVFSSDVTPMPPR